MLPILELISDTVNDTGFTHVETSNLNLQTRQLKQKLYR